MGLVSIRDRGCCYCGDLYLTSTLPFIRGGSKVPPAYSFPYVEGKIPSWERLALLGFAEGLARQRRSSLREGSANEREVVCVSGSPPGGNLPDYADALRSGFPTMEAQPCSETRQDKGAHRAGWVDLRNYRKMSIEIRCLEVDADATAEAEAAGGAAILVTSDIEQSGSDL
ncbi:hypothetical protein [Chamaesiphon minutus]|uniref:Uncharacterized protein n=1 Tax=Chamaesiphon minutus (strain ATCC 27169 / PCC 6605) TaxID=1173020 RepID=K9UFB2_CHAP6|nr:hypothetical protein [Chamaesiphon minutus]AFY93782.1 hypothetical protein Cha6605_2743 [Chamaesiphon minutus PCC 6605]